MNWKPLLAAFVLLAAAVAGCGSDDCTRANDQLAACAPPMMSSSSSSGMAMTTACAGFALCEAQCINGSTCNQILGNAPAYTKCLASCQGK